MDADGTHGLISCRYKSSWPLTLTVVVVEPRVIGVIWNWHWSPIVPVGQVLTVIVIVSVSEPPEV